MAKDRTLTPDEQRAWKQAMGELPREKKTEKPAAPTAPTKKKKTPTTPLDVKSGKQAARALKPSGLPQATLDLHGIGKIEAYGLVQDFLNSAYMRGKRHVAIITGKGRTSDGILRASLPHWVNEPGLRRIVGTITQASPDKGGSGVFHVLLKAHER